MKDINIIELMKEAKAGAFQLNCGMDMGYMADYPIISILGNKACLKIPFLKYKITGEIDKTLVYPVKYVLTYSLPDMRPVGFEDLQYNGMFRKVDFGKPVGYFRHEAIKSLTKKTYKAKKEELLNMYSDLAVSLINKVPFAREEEFKSLLGMMIEPSVKPIYKAIDREFYDKYLA